MKHKIADEKQKRLETTEDGVSRQELLEKLKALKK